MGPYQLVALQELATAPWVQAWGSMVGAALGAGLAVYGAVWFERRHSLRQAKTFAESARYVVRRVQVEMDRFREAWAETAQADKLQPSLSALSRMARVFDRLCPFSELQHPEVEVYLIELTELLGIFHAPARLVEGTTGHFDMGAASHRQFVAQLDAIDRLCRNILARMHRGPGAPG